MKGSRLVVALIVGVAVTALVLGSMRAQEAPPARDVVIVWCGGVPDAPPLPGLEAGAVDTVTQSTPGVGNIKEVAGKLAKELEAAGRTVLVVAAEDCRDPRVIVNAKALVLGSPDYFGLPAWQMVRFADETLYRIRGARIRLTEHVVTSFATTDRVLEILQRLGGSTRGKAVDGAVIAARGTSPEERDAAVKQLAERIVAGLAGKTEAAE